ncbi:MAG: hypothetical protein HUU20_04715 [Pirellulales bacterium]|nr:hypothetical protein [Pirellulales bacterium]
MAATRRGKVVGQAAMPLDDLIDECWPAWFTKLSGPGDRLPRVLAPGTPLGRLPLPPRQKPAFRSRAIVVAGARDGTAACLASGLRRPGDYNTTLGTTLVFNEFKKREYL